MATSRAVLASLAVFASATKSDNLATPIEKVVELLDGLKDEVEKEGKKEAQSYDKFACFCKEKTKSKSESIKEQQDNIDDETATIEEKSAEQDEKEEELTERKQKHEKLSKELDDEKRRCKKLKTEYEIQAADLSKAISSLEKAKTSLEGSKSKSLLQVKDSSIQESLELADAMGLIETPNRKAAVAFIQGKVDPDDPEYAFHSDKIITLLGELHDDFTDQKSKLDTQWGEDETACNDKKAALNSDIDSNNDAMDTLESEIATLKEEISDANEALDEANSIFKDDSLYLHDLTKKCVDTARIWDQRSAMRFKEIEAIEEATDIINDKAAGADEDANERALLLSKKKPKIAAAKATSAPEAVPSVVVTTSKPAIVATKVQPTEEKTKASHDVVPTFLQTSARNLAKSFLERSQKSASTQDDKRGKVTHMLQAEGKRLSSALLTSLSQRAQKDPFVKIKKLIQDLIERLLTEAKEEATQKGFCDTELGKSKHERDERHNQIYKLLANIGTQKAHKEFLEDEIEELGAEVKKLSADLDEAHKLRDEERDENKETIETAKEGLEAVTEALKVLKDFYKKAAKGKSLLQVNVSASPIDEDAPELAFGGKNTGNQDRAGGIIGMVEVIQSDFDRTVRMTTQEEAESQADFVQFERTAESDIAGKETKIKLDEQDLKSTKTSLKKNREDLKTETGLLDDCLKGIEELKPVCIDTGMSYTERVEKREEEIEALKTALCMVDPEGVESECTK